MSLRQAPLPSYLIKLIETFEGSQEAKKYIITPPLAAGSAFEFMDPYFHAHNQLFVRDPMSEELHALVTSLAAGLTTFITYRTQLKNNESVISFQGDEMGRFGIRLGNGLQLTNGEVVMPSTPITSYFVGVYLGLDTAIGIFPFSTVMTLNAEKRKLLGYGLETFQHNAIVSTYHLQTPSTFLAMPRSSGMFGPSHMEVRNTDSNIMLNHPPLGRHPIHPSVRHNGPQTYGSTPITAVRPMLADLNHIFTHNEERERDETLANLFGQIMKNNDISYPEWKRRVREFLRKRASALELIEGPDLDKSLQEATDSFQRAVEAKTMGWGTFVQCLCVLGAQSGGLELTLTNTNGNVSKHGVEVEVFND